MKKIGYDLDDVLNPFNATLCLFVNKRLGTNFTLEDLTKWELWDIWGVTKEECVQIITDFYHSTEHDNMVPLQETQQAIARLTANRVSHVVTSKPDYLEEKTKVYLDTYFPGAFSSTVFTNHFTGDVARKRTKADVCKELNIESFVDDAPEHVLALHAVGIQTFVFDKPWNRIPMPDGVIRIYSLDEMDHYL